MTASFAIRLDFGLRLVEVPVAARAVAEVLLRPCFGALDRLSGRRKDRWSRHAQPTVEMMVSYLTDPNLDAIALDTKRGGALFASAEVENGLGNASAPVPMLRSIAYLAIPVVDDDVAQIIESTCDLAVAVSAAAGFVAVEPSYGLAHSTAIHIERPKERAGISQQRFRERRARNRYSNRLTEQLAGIEWGTFLGPGHLAKVDLAHLRMSGAFARVVQVSSALAYLQVTEDPMDDLTDDFEDKLVVARQALAPLLMDVSAISLE